MQNRFFVRALEAAKISPEAFAAEFKNADADANASIYSDDKFDMDFRSGDSFIHTIITSIPDEKLPALLAILMQHNVDLEKISENAWTPLSLAALYCKKNTIHFLIENNVNILQPIYYSIERCWWTSDPQQLKIISTMHDVLRSPLTGTFTRKLFQGLDHLFFKYVRNKSILQSTALLAAFGNYINYKKFDDGENNQDTQHAKQCLDLFVKPITDYLYQEVRKQGNDELFVTNAIDNLIVNPTHAESLKKWLEDQIKPLIMRRMRAERTAAFCAGAIQHQPRNEAKAGAAIHKFFQNDGKHDLTRKIFSYLDPEKPRMGK